MSYQAPKNGFRTFLILWGSQSLSVFGSFLTFFALNIWLVQSVYPAPGQQSQLAWAMAAMGLAMGLPGILFAPVAGALADRLDRKQLMFWMDLASGATMTALTVLMAGGWLPVWLMLALLVLLTLTGTVHGAAFDASYAMLVSEAQLPRANGMMQTMQSLSGLLSPAVGATLVALPLLARQGLIPGAPGRWIGGLSQGAVLAMGVDAATFLLAAGVLFFLAIPSPRRADLAEADEGKRPSIWADVRFGGLYIWRRRPLLWLLASFAIANLCMPVGIFLPLIVKLDLAGDWGNRGLQYETALATINTIAAVGGVAGGALVSIWGGLKRRRVVGLLLAMTLGGLGEIVAGTGTGLYVVAAGIFLLDFTGPLANAHSQAIWQGQVPNEMQGRVFAVRRVIAQALWPLSQVLAGWMAGIMRPGAGLAVLGGVLAVVSAVQFLNPQVMKVEDKEYLDQLAANG